MTVDTAAIRADIEAAHAKLHALCDGTERWRMTIPAQPDSDPDLVISRGLSAADKLLDEVDRLIRERDEARTTAHAMTIEYRAATDRATAAEAKLASIRDWATGNYGGIKTPAEIYPGLAAALGLDSKEAGEK